ncbi:cation-translocating P-type ATPase, partial [Ruminococcaceae bacterium OttesenSCG-928-L11]|nr:cation-translocating P-type ATPase [Ruminococcaceae bacterium OttesenSCG-928-L11]
MEKKREALGLTSKEAKRRLFEYGENRLASSKKISALKIFGGQFKDLMIMILLVSTVISVLMGETMEAIAIVVIVLMNAILGFVQEYRTEKTMEALKNMAAPTANVLRDGQAVQLPAAELVPGDVILLKAGDKVPADAKVIEVVSLECDEALLTGESLPVEKRVASSDIAGYEIGMPEIAYMGTVVTKGRGKAEIVSTGMSTEMGKIAGMLHEIEDEQTPLQKKLAQLGKYIAIGCLAICVVVAAAGVLRGYPIFDMLITGISLAVAAVPEGLPAIVTIALALAVNRILKRNALVRKLHSVETLGCANVICTDKTGTLTENKMTVKQISTFDYNVEVGGNGYEQAGEFTVGGRRAAIGSSATLKRLFEIAVACNNSQITSADGRASRDRTQSTLSGSWQANGDPTEIALLIMAAKANMGAELSGFDKQGEIPFDSDRKRMTVLLRDKAGRRLSFSKGAPDILLSRCKYILTDSGVQLLTPAIQRRLIQANEDMAGRAMRVLGFAYKEAPLSDSECEDDMIFVGLTGMIDPPRREVYDAVAKCRQAKIRTVMITGDHKVTACAIAKDIGILRPGDMVMAGAEIDALPPGGLDPIVHKVTVFARVNPGHKLAIVRALKRRGDIVAMTGDGVNDAPAIKEADIGVAMGISGTDVTKSASSIVLLDDNFATLVATVEEGRVVYSNIRKFIRYLLSCNIGEVVTMFLGMIMGLPVVLLPIQILLVNLATDGLPALALGMEPAAADIMTQKPRPANESVFSNGLGSIICFRGCLIGLTTLTVFSCFMRWYGSIDIARTAALLTLVLTQLFHVFECKSETKSLFSINPFDNPALIGAVLVSAGLIALAIYTPFLQTVLSTVALSGEQVLRVVASALVVPVISAVTKIVPKRKKDALGL